MFQQLITSVLLFCSLFIYSQNEPFNCVYNAYLFQYNNIYALNLASGSSILVAENVNDSKINASAYNSADGFLWGFLQEKPRTLIRIGNNFEAIEYEIPSIPNGATSSYVGDIDLNGVYHYKNGKTINKIDLDPNSNDYLNHIGSFNLNINLSVHDWAFNANDNNLYAVEKDTNHLYRINTLTETYEDLGEVPILANNNYTYGAVYFDLAGNLYVSANQTGTIYIVKETHLITSGNQINSNLFAYGPASASNDGARCPTAPVPVENCSNGIDDDGDGLIDCDDPSCSGVAACPTITLTTSANDGGLESNNRLSQKITARNYQRSKLNYKFNKARAPKFNNRQRTLTSTKKNLRDFIPLDVIKNTQTIITSPKDLINITNASDIFSVDYLNTKNQPIASILTLKTNNGVYEHTKYICDRLLGAEILSIGTMYLDEQPFIKTVIKNPGGEIEHVVSFAVRESENNTYTVESHWNLDKYTLNTAFYNYQIWSNSVDDLFTLASSIITSFKSQRNVKEYINSTPPKIYVRKGDYKNGKLNLNIVNTYNKTAITSLTGGIRASETSETEEVTNVLEIENYNSKIEIKTGSLFDFGFRIEDNLGGTPDDLFVSDGPWGVDDSAYQTNILEYEINPNEETYNDNGYRVERNLNLIAETQDYVSAYKAFNPRFKAVNMTEYNMLSLNSKGTGELTVVLMKESIKDWEKQYKYTYKLSNKQEIKNINLNDFTNGNQIEKIDPSDITMVVFLMKSSERGIIERKELSISDIEFTKTETFSNKNESIDINEQIKIIPNPIRETSNITFNSLSNSNYNLKVYNLLGNLIQTIKGTTIKGTNTLKYNKPNVASGIYIYNLTIGKEKNYKGKLIFR